MRGPVYRLTRDLHLYLGLFISPFVLVFSISVFFLVHAWRPRIGSETSTTRVVSALPLPLDLQMLSGRPLIEALKSALEKAGVRGEVGFIRHLVKEQKLRGVQIGFLGDRQFGRRIRKAAQNGLAANDDQRLRIRDAASGLDEMF